MLHLFTDPVSGLLEPLANRLGTLFKYTRGNFATFFQAFTHTLMKLLLLRYPISDQAET